ncbi:Endothelin-converting enzyme 1, partial [Stegodyphus mimosarum]
MGPQFVFMDDNAPPHRTVTVEELLESEDIEHMDWSARSLDLNPVKHVWNLLGRPVAARKLSKEEGMRPMKKLLKDLGGWPVLEENWNSSSFDWVDTLIQLHERGITYNLFMTLSVVKDPRNKLSNIIQLSAGSFGITNYYHESSKLLESFNAMKRYSQTFGANAQTLDDQLLSVLYFEMELYTFLSNRMNKATYITIHELKDKIPQIPWNIFFNTILNDEILEDETILVIDLDAIINVASLIASEDK